MSWIRTKYFTEKLQDLEDFWGFFPRTFLPQTKLFQYNSEAAEEDPDPEMTKVTLFIIDSEQEIKTGVGLDFPPSLLESGQMQLDKGITDALDLSVGS